MTGSSRRILIAGATGHVGKQILTQLLADASVSHVYALGRRAPSIEHPKLMPILTDFSKVALVPAVDEVYLALGTTMRLAGSEAAFRAVDFDAVYVSAQAALAAGAKRAGLVSAVDAAPTSRFFYNRVKGEIETALRALPFDALVIARPSMLLGTRGDEGRAESWVERLSAKLLPGVARWVPSAYRPIGPEAVARALTHWVPRAHGVKWLASGEMLDMKAAG